MGVILGVTLAPRASRSQEPINTSTDGKARVRMRVAVRDTVRDTFAFDQVLLRNESYIGIRTHAREG